jgi:signal transduction histidine kinase
LHQEVNLLSRLIEDLRLLSLADAGRLAFSPESLSPQAILARTATVAAPLARQHKVALHVEQGEGDGVLPNVHADPQRLQQVLANLLDNALRYTPEGGKVTLRAYAISHALGSTEPSSPQLAFEVEDTGAGIAAEDLPYVFDRFYRTDKARTRELGGSGLGLAIVQRLIEAQGGRVEVESTPGVGSTFRVILPIADTDE